VRQGVRPSSGAWHDGVPVSKRPGHPDAIEQLGYWFRHAFWNYVRHGAQYRRDAMAMQALTPLAGSYVPWTYFAMRPSAVVAILNDIAVHHRTHIVECGGGVSTLYIARLLREREGHLYTVEESAEWADALRRQIDKEKLTEYVSIMHAPITDVRLAAGSHQWYSDEVVKELTTHREIDLLIIDGPVAERLPRIRYPALPYFYDSLVESATVVVDDIDRRAEQQIVRCWEEELGLSFERRFLNGIAVAKVARTGATAGP
jgi:predicted O-methyltransferase YrrM